MYRISRVKVLRLMLDRWGTVEQKELAVRVGLTEASVSRLLSGQGFTSETLTKFCTALDCTPNDILVVNGDNLHTQPNALAGLRV